MTSYAYIEVSGSAEAQERFEFGQTAGEHVLTLPFHRAWGGIELGRFAVRRTPDGRQVEEVSIGVLAASGAVERRRLDLHRAGVVAQADS